MQNEQWALVEWRKTGFPKRVGGSFAGVAMTQLALAIAALPVSMSSLTLLSSSHPVWSSGIGLNVSLLVLRVVRPNPGGGGYFRGPTWVLTDRCRRVCCHAPPCTNNRAICATISLFHDHDDNFPEMMSDNYDQLLKLILIGDSGVGKVRFPSHT